LRPLHLGLLSKSQSPAFGMPETRELVPGSRSGGDFA
jgi:hypothetical protein